MYVWYLPEFLLMIVEEDVVNKLVKTRRLIQEQDIETISSKLPGKVIKLKIDEVRPYLDEDALAALQATNKYLFVRNILAAYFIHYLY
jgi:DNA-binding LytR/AlgR family response regulator